MLLYQEYIAGSVLQECKAAFYKASVTAEADPWFSPYRHDGVSVLTVARPDSDLVSLGPDVDHGAAHVLAGLIERLAHQTQELQNTTT